MESAVEAPADGVFLDERLERFALTLDAMDHAGKILRLFARGTLGVNFGFRCKRRIYSGSIRRFIASSAVMPLKFIS